MKKEDVIIGMPIIMYDGGNVEQRNAIIHSLQEVEGRMVVDIQHTTKCCGKSYYRNVSLEQVFPKNAYTWEAKEWLKKLENTHLANFEKLNKLFLNNVKVSSSIFWREYFVALCEARGDAGKTQQIKDDVVKLSDEMFEDTCSLMSTIPYGKLFVSWKSMSDRSQVHFTLEKPVP